MATAIGIVPILSCSQHSLVLVTVNAPQGAAGYSNVSLVIRANGQETTTFNKASFTDGAYKAGVYLPSDMSGPVPFTAEVVKDGCQIATGGPVVSPDVSSGATVSLAINLTANAGPCVPVDGGAGSSGTGGGKGSGGSGTGGVTTGTGGAVGTGGAIGSGGAVGTGGRGGSATGGAVGTGGLIGTGGLVGSGGHGGSATGGVVGSGGVVGTGGLIGTGGIVGSGGVVGSGGGGGKGGSASGGIIGSGGVVGSGGSSGCVCANPNEICQPSTNTCVCSQSDSAACSGIACGSVTNICQKTVACSNVCPVGYYCDVNTCIKLVVTGCGGSVSTGTGLVAGTQAAPICP